MRQPKGIAIFFFTEMWERYGFYIIQGLLVLYLLRVKGYNDAQSYALLGSFTALAYISPIIGGALADKLLGHIHAVILGAILLFSGYALLAVVGAKQILFFAALGLVVMGTGLLKPNVSSLLGRLYAPEDSHRDAGFTLFYVGINAGILLATFGSGYLLRYLGWSMTFFTASIGAVLAVIIFSLGMVRLRLAATPFRWTLKITSAYIVTAASVIISALILKSLLIADIAFAIVCLAVVVVLVFSSLKVSRRRRFKMIAYSLLVVLSVIFWSLYFQMFLSMEVFVSRMVNHHIFGLNAPTPLFLGIEAIGVAVFGFIMGKYWVEGKTKGYHPSIPMKFALSLLFITLGFFVLWASLATLAPQHQLSGYWFILAYLCVSIGELLISPIGLSMVTKLAPPRLVGLLMGIWFVSLGLGGKLAGAMASLAAVPKDTHAHSQHVIYQHAFLIYVEVGVMATIIGFCLVPLLRYLMGLSYMKCI